MPRFFFPLLHLLLLPTTSAWNNGAALTPTRGWQNWNAFHSNFNASLTLEIAHFIKDSGLLAAGFEYITLGGMAYAAGLGVLCAELSFRRYQSGQNYYRKAVI